MPGLVPKRPRRFLLPSLILVVVALAAVTATAGTKKSHSSPVRAAPTKAAAQTAKALPKEDAVITLPAKATGRTIPSGFLGLSIENNAILSYTGTDAHALNPVFLQLVRNLTPGQSPDLRIGGDSTDWAYSPARGLTKPAGVRVTLDDQWIKVVHSLATTLNARLILGVDLEADNRTLASDEAKAFESGIGKSHIEALELGNEPELYPSFAWYVGPHGPVKGRPPGYDFTSFEDDFTSFAKGLPGPLAGPTTGAPKWMIHTADFLSAEPRVKVVTLHRYPVQTCYIAKSSPQYPTVAHLLAPYASLDMAETVAPYVGVAHARHLPLRIDEMNTDSCGSAPGVSDAFVSALWGLDAVFQMAKVGVDGVNMHTYPGATYQLFTFTHTGNTWKAFVTPEYYGLMMFAQAAPAGSRLMTPTTENTNGIETWATRGPDGRTRVVLINQSGNRRTVALNSLGSKAATLERMRAPRLTSTSGVTLGGQSFGAQTKTGLLKGKSTAGTLAPSGGRYIVTLPANSAALITL